MKSFVDNTDLRYQVYNLDKLGNLSSPITKPMSSKERCYKYFNECVQCAIVSINECGSIIEIIDRNLTPKEEWKP